MRGHPPAVLFLVLVRGSIPADAGAPYLGTRRHRPHQVYPRGCGGTSGNEAVQPLDRGLSPRMRGHRRTPRSRGVRLRSIPADAGAPDGRYRWCAHAQVYPRGCGGTPLPPAGSANVLGLSPRMRGHRHGSPARGGTSGSIPADAGAPQPDTRESADERVYPRGCGGTSCAASPNGRGQGLSPRMRGHPPHRKLISIPTGSIPADAGAPIKATAPVTPSWVYPRGCGGTIEGVRDRWPMSGLSPRMRGHLFSSVCHRSGIGSIPADAGAPM